MKKSHRRQSKAGRVPSVTLTPDEVTLCQNALNLLKVVVQTTPHMQSTVPIALEAARLVEGKVALLQKHHGQEVLLNSNDLVMLEAVLSIFLLMLDMLNDELSALLDTQHMRLDATALRAKLAPHMPQR